MGTPVPDGGAPTVVAVLASAGRPRLLGDVVDGLRRQTRPLDRIVICVPDDASVPDTARHDAVVVVGPRGLAAQRNAGMRAAPDASIYVFFDDDAVVGEDYVERALPYFDADRDLVGLTGTVLLDGAASEEIEAEAAARALHDALARPRRPSVQPADGLYGCNFAVRRLDDMVWFDDRLPLYSWLEDRDFSNRLARRGRLVKVDDCVIVHLGAKSGGRMAHVRLGFTQVMNPVYFVRKRSFSVREALQEMLRPVGMNVVRSIAGPARHWRRRRLRGNLIALLSIVRGDIRPERMTEYH